MRVLLVDDEVRLVESVSRGLAADGINVDTAHNGVDGYWRACEGSYDVIVLDIMMPGMNGYAVCQKLRDNNVTTPILMLTAKEGEYDEADAFECGADDYLRKPFSHIVLVARLRSLVRRRSADSSQILTVGELALNLTQASCTRENTPIELTRREFSLLEALMRRSPDVVPKHTLVNLVWGMDFDGDPNIVEVYVGYLRRKIDKSFGHKLLHTVRGVGYQLVEKR